MVNPFVVYKIVKIARVSKGASVSPVRPIAAYLIKRKIISLATTPLIEGMAVFIWNQQIGDVSRQRTRGRGTLIPTTDEAARAWVSGIKAQRSIEGISFMERSSSLVRMVGGVGLTPLVPLINKRIRTDVLEGLGAPRWVIVTAGLAGELTTPF